MKAIIAVLLLSAVCVAQDAKSLYDEALNKLTGPPQNRSDMRGIDVMTRAADQGYLPAIVAVGTIYDTGAFVGSNPSKASDYYRKAVNQGNHFAEYLLGRMYFSGVLTGGRRESEKWLLTAAQAGIPYAAYLYGAAVYDRDPVEAVKWFQPAAEAGIPYAQYALGKALNKGGRVPMDKRQSYLWLYVARESGVSEAATELSMVETDLGRSGVENLQGDARDLRNRVRRASQPTQCKGWSGELNALPTVPPLELLSYCVE
jgi:TPR repeat protein